jgi:hypothetical protein
VTITEQSPLVTDPEVEYEEPTEAHIIARGDDGEDAGAIITRAAVEGTPVVALCGKVFVPSRDPLKLPPCQRCVDAARDIIRMRGSL